MMPPGHNLTLPTLPAAQPSTDYKENDMALYHLAEYIEKYYWILV